MDLNNMQNKSKTILTLTLLVMTAVGLSNIPSAAAHNSPVSAYWFTSSSQNICYNLSSLDSMKYEGSTSQGSTVAGQIQLGEDEMDDNTDLNISHDTSCGTYESEVSSFYDSDTSKAAKTDLAVSTTLGNEYKDMEFNNNSGIDWQEDQSCLASQPNLDWIANHEFGHFAGMEHHGNVFSTHTMMKASCSSSMNQIRSGDITQVNGEY